MNEFKVGDKVQCINGNSWFCEKGYITTVKALIENSTEFWLEGVSGRFPYGACQLKEDWVLVEPAVEHIMEEEFKVGDFIQVTKSLSSKYYNIGDKGIIKVKEHDGSYYVDFNGEENKKVCAPGLWYLTPDEMTHQTTMVIADGKITEVAKTVTKTTKKAKKKKASPQFKVGDVVISTVSSSWYHEGDKGVITKIDNSDNTCKVDFNNQGNKKVVKGGIYFIYLNQIKKSDTTKEVQPIQAGDVVVITNSVNEYYHNGDKGFVYSINVYDDKVLTYMVDFKGWGNKVVGAGKWSVSVSECEKSSAIEALKVGDTIKVKKGKGNPHYYHYGDKGIVEKVNNLVNFNGCGNLDVYEDGKRSLLSSKVEKCDPSEIKKEPLELGDLIEGGNMPPFKEEIQITGTTKLSKDIPSGTYFTGSIGGVYSGLFLKIVTGVGDRHFIIQINNPENYWESLDCTVNDFKSVKINITAD